MSGFDLIQAVVSMKATSEILVAALTRFDLDDHIAKTFSAVEYQFL
jgi:hypothetical protein